MYDKRTKIVCTIGPSSWVPEVMKKMIENGMNCARVNGAFADGEEMEKVTKLVRDVSDDVSLMIDVKGPEVRMNKFGEAKEIQEGDEIVIGSTTEDEIYPANYPNLYNFVEPDQKILVGDGDVVLEVREIEDGKMYCEVEAGNLLKPGKALNLPGVEHSKEILTEKDRDLIEHAKRLNWDFVSGSFISSAEDAKEVQQSLEGSSLKLIAKIEDEEGVVNLDEILPEVYGIMIARGGLGVEMGLDRMPLAQDYILQTCVAAKKNVIAATQYLESMTENPRPTRAEAHDVSTAIRDGADVVMLSAESTTGKYPAEAVEMISKIAMETEATMLPWEVDEVIYNEDLEVDSMIKAVIQFGLNMDQDLDAIVTVSQHQEVPKLIGKNDLVQPIYALVNCEKCKMYLSIEKGVRKSAVIEGFENKEELVKIISDKFDVKGKVLVISIPEEDFDVPKIFEVINV